MNDGRELGAINIRPWCPTVEVLIAGVVRVPERQEASHLETFQIGTFAAQVPAVKDVPRVRPLCVCVSREALPLGHPLLRVIVVVDEVAVRGTAHLMELDGVALFFSRMCSPDLKSHTSSLSSATLSRLTFRA